MDEKILHDPDVCLLADDIEKIYPGTKALDHVTFRLMRGKVNALIGENGAGKSTLMKIIAGIEKPSSGKLYMDGEELDLENTRDAKAKGIAIIHQELSIYQTLNVFQNIFMGSELTRGALLDDRSHIRKAKEVLERLGHPIDPLTRMSDLSVGQQQIIEIARNLVDPNLKVLIMDEPTSSLSAQEVSILFKIIRDLKGQGISIVYISHRLEEIMEIGDCVTVLRDGRVVDSAEVRDVSVPWIVEKMVGENAGYDFPERPIDWSKRETTLKVEHITLPKRGGGYVLEDVSFSARQGEILGVYGLLGAGRTELFECIMGLHPMHTGIVFLNGEVLKCTDVAEQVDRGFALVPENRQKEGLVQTLNIKKNTVLSSMKKMTRFGILKNSAEINSADQMIRDLHIKVADKNLPILSLSGGNQQKVVIGKGILTDPKVLLMDEPSRGIDVRAKAEVFEIIRQYAEAGLTIVMISSELKEVMSVADRIIVLSGGKLTGEFMRGQVTENELVKASYKGHGRE